jgi:hypothetical protein
MGGDTARDIEYAVPGSGTVIYRLVLLHGPTTARFIMLMAGGRNVSPDDRRKFIESFHVKFRP